MTAVTKMGFFYIFNGNFIVNILTVIIWHITCKMPLFKFVAYDLGYSNRNELEMANLKLVIDSAITCISESNFVRQMFKKIK